MKAAFRIILSALALSFVTLCASAVLAQNAASPDQQPATLTGPYREMYDKAQRQFGPKPSTDTTLVDVVIGGAHYLIPRNYFVYVPPALPTLLVSWPGLEARNENNRHCFTPMALAGRVAECTALELRLQVGGPGLRQEYNNLTRNLTLTRKGEIYGYEVRHLGPADDGADVYWKDDPQFPSFFDCSSKSRVCDDKIYLEPGMGLAFFFWPELIPQLPQVEASIRQFMENFRQEKSR
jgi:hypothetical protein